MGGPTFSSVPLFHLLPALLTSVSPSLHYPRITHSPISFSVFHLSALPTRPLNLMSLNLSYVTSPRASVALSPKIRPQAAGTSLVLCCQLLTSCLFPVVSPDKAFACFLRSGQEEVKPSSFSAPKSFLSTWGQAMSVRLSGRALKGHLPASVLQPRPSPDPGLGVVSVPTCILLPLQFHLQPRWSHVVRNRGQGMEGTSQDHTARWGQRGWSPGA